MKEEGDVPVRLCTASLVIYLLRAFKIESETKIRRGQPGGAHLHGEGQNSKENITGSEKTGN